MKWTSYEIYLLPDIITPLQTYSCLLFQRFVRVYILIMPRPFKCAMMHKIAGTFGGFHFRYHYINVRLQGISFRTALCCQTVEIYSLIS